MKSIIHILAAVALVAGAARSAADITLGVDPSASWNGYLNRFTLGGTYLQGDVWGTQDLRANFSGNTLTLEACQIGDPNAYWYVGPELPAPGPGGPGVAGNKLLEANFYVERSGGALSGQKVIFTGKVNTNTLTDAHNAVAFIKDFAPNYSSSVTITVPLKNLPNGIFRVEMDTINDSARHVQYGFQTTGVNVWPTDLASFGKVEVESLPVVPPTTNKTVDPLANWIGYMNQFELPENGGAPYLAPGGPWGVGDLKASFSGANLTLGPNMINPVGGINNSEYFKLDGKGKKIMEANMYVQIPDNTLNGQTITFSGTVLSNTLTSAHTAVVFIKEFAPDYSSYTTSEMALTPGPFSVSLNTSAEPGRHIQYGFQMVGPNVWQEDPDNFGNVVVTGATGPTDAFTTWINTYNFSAFSNPNLTKSGDPDGDGVNNFAEFALNGDPSTPGSRGNIRSRIETVGGQKAVVLTLAVRGEATFGSSPSKVATVDGLVYTIEGTNDFVLFDQGVTEIPVSSVGMDVPDTGWNHHSFRLNGAVDGATPRGPKGFLRAKIAPAPPAP